MTSLLIAGYKAFEIGLASEKDIRIKVIKEAVRRDLLRFLEEGLDWIVFMGNLGFEAWVLEVANELKADYGFQTATIFLFENHGQNWNEANQARLAAFKQVDFVKYAYPSYQNPSQFRDYNHFIIQNTDGAYLFYDEEQETKLNYLYQEMKKQEQYFIKKLTFDDLNEAAENFSEN
ncbi:hypothetical protein STRDD11_00026 [Streptococcus sp. DD11]|uniref:DUF1273 domain-containing protein n=1 Tax=Streptococcus sp. DD11 TaxID=1777879 RepID=UPI000795783E|nr:DUF1273 domain-containing protein [Streptococcus sp. DD11]KXT86123.1 hypothetical protein STRDD11_00026 [Streptococcus sp. DD11]